AVATASYRPIIDTSLEAVGIGPETIVVEGKGDLQGKPEPDLFLASQKRLGVEAADCIVVGDAIWDHVAARRAAMMSVGVLTGGYGEEEVYHARAFPGYRSIAHPPQELGELGILLSAAGMFDVRVDRDNPFAIRFREFPRRPSVRGRHA